MRRKEFAVIKSLSWNYFRTRLIGLIYIYIYKLSQKAKRPPLSTLCDRDIRIAVLSSLAFSLSSSLLEILSTFLTPSFHLSSAFPLRFRLALATHSPDIERTSRGLLPRTGGCSPSELAGWLAACCSCVHWPTSALSWVERSSLSFSRCCITLRSNFISLSIHLRDRIQRNGK